MAKEKTPKGGASVPNKALHSRISYLYQAAAYLATQVQENPRNLKPKLSDSEIHRQETKSTSPLEREQSGIQNHSTESSAKLSQLLLTDMRSVSQKMQIRLSPAMKHTICKRCDTLLIDGSTCINEVENKSRGGKKPWADVLLRTCKRCGCEKRFPLNTERQKRRPLRERKTQSRSVEVMDGIEDT
jgi:ribonuclease P protein subunit RPR2